MSTARKVSEATVLYRIEDILGEDGVSLVIRRFAEVKKTPFGRWVCQLEIACQMKEFGGWTEFRRAKESKLVRWVSSNSIKSHCYEDFRSALNSYMRRKTRQEIFARAALETSELAMKNEGQIMRLSPDDFTKGVFPTFLLGKIDVLDRYVFD